VTFFRALALWFAVAIGAIALLGLHAYLDADSTTTPVWRSA
jgi:hypothetical protein